MNIYTGSYIGLGVVFSINKKDDIVKCIDYVVDKFQSNNYVLTNYFDKTDTGNEYIRTQITSADIETLYNSDFFTIKFETTQNNVVTQILVSNSFLENFVSIQIDFHEESFIKCYNGNYEKCVFFIEQLCAELYQYFHFEYAYCDNNANFEFIPSIAKENGFHNCSLMFFPFDQGLKVIRQSWELDGFTTRSVDMVGEFWLKKE